MWEESVRNRRQYDDGKRETKRLEDAMLPALKTEKGGHELEDVDGISELETERKQEPAEGTQPVDPF